MTRAFIPAALLVLTAKATAQSPRPAVAYPVTRYSAAIDQARAFVRDTMQALGAPGAQVTVMQGGKVIWSEGFGFADLEQQVPVTPITRFRVGSVSKSLTSAALGKLVETGKLDLDQPIQQYVPSFPAKRWPITTRQLAGHLAGIRHYKSSAEFELTRHYATVTEALDIFKDDSLLFEPGTKYSYSSFGWNLVSAVIEGASGEPFLRFVEREVFGQADLRHTAPDYVDSIIPNRARWYTRGPNKGGIINAPLADNSYKWAGGGFVSTTDDLVSFGDAMLHGRLLKPETIKLLWTSQQTRDGKPTKYGMGWGVETDKNGRWRISHSGGAVGGTAFLVIYPDALAGRAVYLERIETLIAEMQKDAGVRLPGARRDGLGAKAAEAGVEIPAALADQLQRLADA